MKKRKLLMIPGPIEFEPAVLQAMAKPTTSHVAPNFIDTFGNCLELMRKVWLSDTGQPFIVAGSGTLAMDMAAANLLEAGDRVLVIATGYFGDRYADLCQRYGADVRILSAAPGETVPMETIEKALATDQYKLVTMTHVDTATGVRIDPKPIAKLAQQYGALSVLDGVCSVAGEEIRQEAWGLDVVLTASQKAIGVPPGLALLVVSQKAMQVYKNRNSVVGNYYADFTNWLPIMEAYENRRPAYFGTPPVNLIAALEVSLQSILLSGMEGRFLGHQKIAQAFRAAVKALGLVILPKEEHLAANTMTAVYYPEGIDPAVFLQHVGKNDVIIAGGLLPALKTRYFRVGHMGSVTNNDLIATVAAIENSLVQSGHSCKIGAGLKAAQDILTA